MNNKIQELFETAEYHTKAGNSAKAIEAYKKVLKLKNIDDEATHLAHWGIGDIYLNLKNYKKAEYHLTKALELEPKQSYYHYLLGCTYTYKNHIEKAIYHLEKAVEIDDSIEIYWGQLGWVVGHKKDFKLGVKYLKCKLQVKIIPSY